MKTYLAPLLVAFFASLPALAQGPRQEEIVLEDTDTSLPYVAHKVWLQSSGRPVVKLVNSTYVQGTRYSIFQTSQPQVLSVVMGTERKRPFAWITMPATMPGVEGRLRFATLSVEESEGEAAPAARGASVATSVLATGTWYKIAVPGRGFYKLDHSFLTTTLGIPAAGLASANIRVFGNGGTMLPEAVSAPRIDDLAEVGVWMQDGGDGTLGAGDYCVFYAPGATAWNFNPATGRWEHNKNIYEDRSYYFINVDGGTPGKRLAAQPAAPAANVQVTAFDEYAAINEDKINVGKFGRRWWGDELGSAPGRELSKTYSIPLPGALDSVWSRVAIAVGYNQSGDAISATGPGGAASPVHSFNFPTSANADKYYPYRSMLWVDGQPVAGAGSADYTVSFQPAGGTSSRGYIDFIEANWRRALQFSGNAMSFRDSRSAGSGRVANYTLGNAPTAVQVWDVTDPATPVRMATQAAGGGLQFSREAEAVREFAAFADGGALATPSYVGRVQNQNLHGLPQTDYVIITHPTFRAAAERLAAFHQSSRGLRTTVATVDQIYNEFGGGSQDITAIRDFLRMFYERAGTDSTQMPRYVLMFGDASYDYKDRVAGNTNYVPLYEGEQSEDMLYTIAGDDFFAMLDAGEDINSGSVFNTLDVGIGRLPVKTAAEADAMVTKIIRYRSPASLGPWRTATMHVADNEDGAGTHLANEEVLVRTVGNASVQYNPTKVYLDNIPFVSSPGGTRAPEANKSINDAIFRGTFLMNYSGHGSPATLADERVVTADDFNAWRNGDKMPIIITATCDFSQFDQPTFESAGEKLVLKGDGGTIGMLTTVLAVYSDQSLTLNSHFLQDLLAPMPGGGQAAMGDALRMGKNRTYAAVSNPGILINFRKFALLGDPALLPAMPTQDATADSVVATATGARTDTVAALGAYTLYGTVRDKATGAPLTSFNGRVWVTIYDKARRVETPVKNYPSERRVYYTRNNAVYRGRGTATGGQFRLDFVAPKDLNFEMGAGRISVYAEDGTTDAAGTDTSMLKVGGYSDNPVVENNPPIVRPYMNDSLFRNGGLTNPNSVLFVVLEDETGINVSGNAVGHDLIAVLDGNTAEPLVMNDYYETAPNTYRRGYVRFPVRGLADGKHTLRVRAWDVNNNSGEGTVAFEVLDGAVTRVDNLSAFPNPFRDRTRFVWEHNQNDVHSRAQIQIFTTAGALVRRMDVPFTPGGSRTAEVDWDGTGDGGQALPPGVYLYRLVFSAEGTPGDAAYQKVVLLR